MPTPVLETAGDAPAFAVCQGAVQPEKEGPGVAAVTVIHRGTDEEFTGAKEEYISNLCLLLLM